MAYAADELTAVVAQLEAQLRELKTAQQRAGKTMVYHTANTDVTMDAGATATVWLGTNPTTTIANIAIPGAAALDAVGLYQTPVYDLNKGVGYELRNAGDSRVTVPVQIVANQALALEVA